MAFNMKKTRWQNWVGGDTCSATSVMVNSCHEFLTIDTLVHATCIRALNLQSFSLPVMLVLTWELEWVVFIHFCWVSANIGIPQQISHVKPSLTLALEEL